MTQTTQAPTSLTFGVPWEAMYSYSQAVRRGSTIYISGQLSHDLEANFVGEGDFELQTRTALANLDRVLEHFGASRQAVVETTVFVKDLRQHFEDICRLHAEYFGTHWPTSNLIGVADLALPPQLVEIAAVAILDAAPPQP
jgi:enamine deaminase RidA (YjgF/YER057c/UK114 family)